MKLSLVVLTPGKGAGKTIPIAVSPFLIGRDPGCHLRPASPVISKRHCAVLVQGSKVIVKDFNSTNGTFVNDHQIKGDFELQHDDQLRVGPLVFRVQVESGVPVNQSTPPPPTKKPVEQSEDEMAGTMLLELGDAGPSAEGMSVDSEGIPTGSTVMEILPPQSGEPEAEGKAAKKAEPAKPVIGDTTAAAKSILEKYLRRTRT